MMFGNKVGKGPLMKHLYMCLVIYVYMCAKQCICKYKISRYI